MLERALCDAVLFAKAVILARREQRHVAFDARGFGYVMLLAPLFAFLILLAEQRGEFGHLPIGEMAPERQTAKRRYDDGGGHCAHEPAHAGGKRARGSWRNMVRCRRLCG